MVEKVVIYDNTKSPVRYLSSLDTFNNGKSYEFHTGVNIIVGENGSGKTTLLKIIEKYLLVDEMSCAAGMYNCNINSLFTDFMKNKMLDGVGVYADYTRNTYRLCHCDEKTKDSVLDSFENFGMFIEQNSSSTGEAVSMSVSHLFNYIFNKKTDKFFNYRQFEENYHEYCEYIEKHHIDRHDEWTILMDEPDRNLSIDNIEDLKSILSFHKPNTQIIAVIHNPLIIYALAKNKNVHFIEMTKDYVKKVTKAINELTEQR